MSGKNFAKIPEDLLCDAEISSTAVRIYGVLQRYAGKNGTAFPGREELADRLGVHVNTVKRALVELVDSGWIERTRRPCSNVWDTAVRVVPDPEARVQGRPVPTQRRGTKNDPTVGTKNDPTVGTTNDPRSSERVTKNAPTSVPKTTRPSVPKTTRLDEREPLNESQLTRVTSPVPDDAAPDDGELPLGLPTPAVREPDPVQVLVGAYVLAVEDTGGIATKSQRAAIGRNVKRLITDDHIELPVILVAVQRAGSKRSRTVDPFLGAIQSAWNENQASRNAMRSRWYEIASAIDARKDAS